MTLYEVTSKPEAGVKTWTDKDADGNEIEREAIRVTMLEAEDDAEAKVRVNDSNRAVADETDTELYKVTKVRKV